jgi:hypothetical protein
VAILTCPLSLQQILAPLMSSCGYTHALCRKGGERRPRRAARSSWRSGEAKDHADMRLTCGSPVVRGVSTHLQLLFAARGPPKTSSEPRRGRGIVFRNSRISLSAGRRACEPAAKPAISGVILLHYGFVCSERTRCGGLPALACCSFCATPRPNLKKLTFRAPRPSRRSSFITHRNAVGRSRGEAHGPRPRGFDLALRNRIWH